jgi:hypothetical protein
VSGELVGPRRNLAPEPVPLPGTRWISNRSLTWVQVTGFARPYAVRLVSPGSGGEHYILPAPGVTPVGQPVTVAVSYRTDVVTQVTAYVIFYDINGTVVGATDYPGNPITTVAGEVATVYITGTPGGTAVAAGAQISTISSSTAVLDATMALAETTSEDLPYFDGDDVAAGARWDGLGGTSTSTLPAPAPPSSFTPVPDAYELYQSLGPWTLGDEDTGWTLLRLCDAWARMLQPVDDLVRDTSDGPGWSQVLDVDRCPTGVLPWLGQFVGVDVDRSLTDEAQRDQIRDQQAEARGTPATILAVARAYLDPSATVRLIERDGDPYRLTVNVFSQGLIGETYNALQTAYPSIAAFEAAYPTYDSLPSSGGELASAVEAATPAGLLVTVNTDAHATYDDVQTFYPTQAAFQAAFATWADVAAWIPPS